VLRVLERSHRLLTSPVGITPRALALAAALLILPTYFLPLWNLTMFAPQYQGGLRLDIYSYRLEGGNRGQDLKEINLLNHYIGMRDLAPDDFTEFKWMPFVLGGLALVFLRAAVVGRMLDLVDAFVLFAYFGLFSLWSFAYKLYRYGHDLAPTAPVKVDPFMPPLLGGQQIANFEVYSYPGLASYAAAAVGLALLLAVSLGARAARRARLSEEAAGTGGPVASGAGR
jgi:copper chaperone NosL